MKNENPLVSIVCTTFNQERFISQALDGFLMQDTRFPFEIIVNDDASVDSTADIVKEYYNRYPDLIVPIFQNENQYSKNVSGWTDITFPKARGKYIATCEGDDYWTDHFKLQKQVEFMEAHPEVALCFTNAKVMLDKSGKLSNWPVRLTGRYYEEREIMFDLVIPTCSVLFRNELNEDVGRRLTNKKHIMGDLILWLSIAQQGKLYCLNEQMVVYRRNEGSVAYKLPLEKQIRLVEQHEVIAQDFNLKYKDIEEKFLSRQYLTLGLKCLAKSDRRAWTFLRKSVALRPERIMSNVFYLFKRLFISNRSL